MLTNPDRAKEPELAYQIAIQGMTYGWFTGKKLSNYFFAETADYFNARRMINIVDKAEEIANIARGFSEILRESKA